MSEFRLAILTDVHGNRFALEAVLADIDAASPDLTVNLGDLVWGHADPRGALDVLQAHNFPTVRGNTDEYLAHFEGKSDAWLAEQLSTEEREWLGRLPISLRVADGEVLLAHGTPHSPHQQLLFQDDEPVSRAVLQERLHGVPDHVRVVAVGHTHLEAVARVGGKLIVNVGAVSRQKDGDPHARWVLLRRQAGVWHAEFRRVPYDFETAARWAEVHAPQGQHAAENLRTGIR
ncbi:metallophosphoesterase family protein [Deinococcus peraridilitoris]|uniref:Putative phosphoesterase n=1 Tax=Deinococcus peraridilitoris (strain DSM 19664 / LMG 22246 / CIP 109416 / KR-200) TaxID=937777 RepID=K9ZVZ8_DEIPD|nr:metallophosphoesterase family protein [Deinococcus peraridilitoris]AFZ65731.1 putative phosphoesterase [Deinococcus peraridilitoris DSM 19664]